MRSHLLNRVVIGAFIAGLGLFMVHTEASAAGAPEEFYRGKTLNWIVASSPGSPTDLIVRIIAPFLAKEIGAKVKVEDRKTDEGINYLYNQGTRDGLTLGSKVTNAIIGNEITKAPGTLYQTDKFHFVADVYPAVKVFVISPKLPYKTLDALRQAKGLRAGGTSARGDLALNSAVMLEVLGLDGKVITGFNGKKDMTLALARGEVDIAVTPDDTSVSDEKDGYLINLFTVAGKRSIVLPKVPSLSEIGAKVPKELEAVHKFIMTGGMAVALPPGVPPDRVEYLRKVFQSLNNNNELQQAMTRLTGAWRTFVPGEELQQEMADILANKGLATQLDAILKKVSAVR
jgi:tripartite-type tricarboxylate transporter receptor subunit TctC